MNLIILAAFVAIVGAAKLDRHYLPPPSAKTAGGRPEDLQLPFAKNALDQGPKGSSLNEFDGVVVDAASETAGPRQTDETGLGGPRNSYGSTNSKVGEAAFAAQPTAGFRLSPGKTSFDALGSPSTENEIPQAFRDPAVAQNFNGQSQRIPPGKDHAANTLRYESDVQSDRFRYAYDTDNGISASAVGVEANGVQAQGGFSYKSDDGQVYSVMYTADEGGYQPKGDHLPTPPPIPDEILRSIEQNARDEAAGVVDDGSYDASKYNTEGDYTESGNINGQYNTKPLFSNGNRPGLVATGSSVNGNNGFSQPINNAEETNINIPVRGQSDQVFPSNNGRPVSNTAQPGTFGQSSSNSFGNINEYLPPVGAGYTGKPQRPSLVSSNYNNAIQTPLSSFSNIPSQSNGQSQDRPHNFQGNYQPGNKFQFPQYSNGFLQKPSLAYNKPNQLSHAKQSQSQFQTLGSLPTSLPQFGIQSSSTLTPLNSQGQEQFKLSALSSQPTGQPSIELSTPYETSEYESNKDDTDTQSLSSSPSTSGFGSFTLQNFANRPSQGQLSSQSSDSQQNGFGATASPSVVSTSLNVQLPNSRPQSSNNYRPLSVSSSSFSSPFNNKQPFSQGQNSNIQVSSTTQVPFGQNLQYQGQETYQYNHPSKPFNNVFSSPQGPNFLENHSSLFSVASQGNAPVNSPQIQDNNKYSNPTTLSPIGQNSPAQSFKPNYNGITQASASSFGSVLPTQSVFGNNKNNGAFPAFGSFNSFQKNLNGKPSSIFQQSQVLSQKSRPFLQSSFSTTVRPEEKSDLDNKPELSANSEQISQGQQYNGELYEYNKPEQSLPAPDSQDTTNTEKNNNDQFSQFGNQPQLKGNTDNQGSSSFQLSSQQPFGKPQLGQNSLTNGNGHSLSQATLTQGSRPFGLTGQFGSQFGQKLPLNAFSQLASIGIAPSSQSGSQGSLIGTGLTQNNYSQTRPNGNKRPVACCQPSASLQISQPTQAGQNTVSQDLSKQSEELPASANSEVPSGQSVAGQGEIFGSPNRKPPSFDKTGYHY